MGGSLPDPPPPFPAPRDTAPPAGSSSWRRILLMILAITIHNIPGKSWLSVHPPQPLSGVSAILEGSVPSWGGQMVAAAFSPFCFLVLLTDGPRRAVPGAV